MRRSLHISSSSLHFSSSVFQWSGLHVWWPKRLSEVPSNPAVVRAAVFGWFSPDLPPHRRWPRRGGRVLFVQAAAAFRIEILCLGKGITAPPPLPAHFEPTRVTRIDQLKPIIQLKNFIVNDPNGCIPVSVVSKRGLEFDISIRVASFLRQYPSVFEEFRGEHNLPWFRLTPEASEIDKEEKRVFKEDKEDLKDRLRRFVLMSKDKVLPLKIIKGMTWYLGLPDSFLEDSKGDLDE
ncbi:Cysteine proteinases superfamily protein, putative isoform 1 [Hibiscus syriacus]|uniref:Cysteine proteinases superfamily protein, putative isoform 1 n=1 Tax=Hibiscus syriacus TaxID=106335 RepID=A0A6A3D6V5_HIBSY|nr:Cysteine proteinases superfamily protein, putative isoform 1 [Hibiscus syriacus]